MKWGMAVKGGMQWCAVAGEDGEETRRGWSGRKVVKGKNRHMLKRAWMWIMACLVGEGKRLGG